jgi:hypothetical protein
MNQPSNKRTGTATPHTKPARTQKTAKKSAKQANAVETGHKQRFDQLLDDVVFGKPTKR